MAFLDYLKSRQLTAYSRNNYWRSFSAFINWLYRSKFIEVNPLHSISGPTTPRPLPKAPPRANVFGLLNYIKKQMDQQPDNWHFVRDMALFSLALDTGARIGELSNLTMEEVDLIDQQINLHVASKTDVGRVLELGDDAAVDLTVWVGVRVDLLASDRIFEDNSHPWCDWLFMSNYQHRGYRRFTEWGIRQRLAQLQKWANLPRHNFHALRHAYAVYSIRNGADLIDVKDQMGHTSIHTTNKYLQVVNDGRKARHRRTSPRSVGSPDILTNGG
jgi:integrase/recombinase XerC